MKKIITIYVLLCLGFSYSQTLTNVWNTTGNAGQKWTSYRFRDGAVNNTSGTYDGRVYITSAATTIGIIYYNKSSWNTGSTPSSTPDGTFGSTRPDGGSWGTASPNGITIDGDEFVYVSDFGAKKIAVYNGDGSSGAWLKQTDGSTDLVLTQNARLIRAFGSGANTKIYYGNGNSTTSQTVYVISKSGSGWSESLLFSITLGTARSIQSVIAKSSGNTVYVSYNGPPNMEKYDNISGTWTKDANFTPTGFTVSQLNGASFADASENYIAVGDGSNRTFNILDSQTGLRIAGINFGVTGEGMDNGAIGFMYDSQTFFGCGSRGAVGGYFEKITSDVPIVKGTTPYRTATGASGGYTTVANWEYFDGSSWQPATHYPYVIDGSVTIRGDAAITSGANLNVEELTIESGGIFTTTSGILYVNNGTGTDININGTLKHSSTTSASFIFTNGATCQINDGGTYIHNTTASAATPLSSMTFSNNSNMVFQGSSTLTPAFSFSGRSWGNLSLESTSGAYSLTATGSVSTTVNGNFTIGSGVTLTSNYTGTLTIGGNFTNNGTLTNNTGTQVYTFAGSNKTIGGSSTSAFETFNINSDASITLTNNITIASGFTATIGGMLDCGTYTIGDAGAFTVSGGATLKSGSATGINGNITTSGTKTFSTSANYEFNGSLAQVTGSLLPATVNNLTINNSAGVTLSGSTQANGTLTLTSGRLSLGAYNLTLGAAASVSGTFSASNMIVADGAGELRKEFSSDPGGSFTLPIGDNTGTAEYSPVTISSLTATGYSSAYIGVRVVNDKHPNYTGIHRLNRYWVMSSSGITGMNCNTLYTYVVADVVGTETNLKGMKYSSSTWTILDAVDNLNHNFTANGLTSFSDFTAASESREILVDGDPADWIGTAPGTSHETTYSNGEFIYKGVAGDERTDYNGTQSSSDNDLSEFRVGTDGTWLYLLIKMRDITNVDYPHICLVFTNGTSSQTFIGDDSKKSNTNGGASTDLANSSQYGRLVDIHSTTTGNPGMELYDGGIWYAPPTSGWATSFSTTNDAIEAKIALADLGITSTSTTNISLMTTPNRVGWNNDVDGTAWGTEDQTNGVDVMTPGAADQNAWFRDLSDGNVGSYATVNFNNAPLPVELNAFKANAFGKDVKISWSTSTEVNSYQFVIERSGDEVWKSIADVDASGNSNSPKEYSFTDKNLAPGKYAYRLKMIDNDGTFEYSDIVEAEVIAPTEFALYQNYPNPFNPVTTINYSIPVDASVQLYIFTITGELVQTLVNEQQAAGSYSVNFDARQFASGTYIYRLVANDFAQTKKMVLLK